MQQIPLTIITLAALSVLLLILRARWKTLRCRTRRSVLLVAIAAIALFVVGYATHWVTASDRLNAAFYWSAVAGYLLLLSIHSLTRPRWLTSITAIVLAAPVLASSLFLPLGSIFHPNPRRIVALGTDLYVSWQPFVELGPSSSGVDVEIFYRPPLLPFLQHSRLGGRFYDRRCNGAATEVVLQPDHESVFVRCPSWPNSIDPSLGEYLRLH